MKLNGTLINYYFNCKRKCYLSSCRLNLEDNSADVKIGKVLHELKQEKSKLGELQIDNIKIDQITDDYIVEYKKRDSDIEAVKWQLIYYLYVLKNKGVIKKGKIVFEEYDEKKTMYISLTKEIEEELLIVLKEVETLINGTVVPIFKEKKHCRKCAYYSYCKL